MADSDDDYNDGKRRDHRFKERMDYQSNHQMIHNRGNWQQQQSNSQDNWNSNRNQYYQQRTDSYGRRDRNYNNQSNYNYDQPPAKRNRTNNWNEDRQERNQYHQYESNYDYNQSFNNQNQQQQNDNTLTQPPFLSFKQFMKNLDDSVGHEDASNEYNKYIFEFKRKQIIEFFNAHKDEEWFRIKYHPIESAKRKKVLKGYVKHRAQVFFELYNKGLIDSTTVDIEKSDQITKILDSIVIKLEGGTDHDLKCLEIKKKELTNDSKIEEKEQSKNELTNDSKLDNDDKNDDQLMKIENGSIDDNVNTNESDLKTNEQEEKLDMQIDNDKDDDEEKLDFNEEINDTKQENKDEFEEKNDRQINESNNENNQSITDKQNVIKNEFEIQDNETKDKNEINNNELNNDNDRENGELNDDENQPRPLHKTLSIFLRYLPGSTKKEEVENLILNANYPGFLRIALADPNFDKRFQRRGWVTFDRTVDIRKICSNLNSIKIHDCDLGAIINRDLSRRIRSVNGIASHRLNVLADLKHATKIILNLDNERGIWENDTVEVIVDNLNNKSQEMETENSTNANKEENQTIQNESQNFSQDFSNTDSVNDNSEKQETETLSQQNKSEDDQLINENVKKIEPVYVVKGLEEKITVFDQETRNPLLVDIEAYLKAKSELNEESTVNEETGEIKEETVDETEPRQLERDEDLIKVLDKFVFYLRIVHSLDFYNHIDYPNEDEMPNRIGIMHARGMIPTANITLKEVNDYIKSFGEKISIYTQRNVQLNEEEVIQLGKRNVEDEIEKFIKENTKEIKTDKWLCPLSGKKFKGPEYVRKHIETKHADKLEIVRQDTEYFNQYLADSRRPCLAEHPFNRQGHKQQNTDNHLNQNTSNSGLSNNVHHRLNYNQNNSGYNNRYNNFNRNMNNNRYNNNNRKRFYRDLDAPNDDF